MSVLFRSLVLSIVTAAPLVAQEHGEGGSLLDPKAGLMFWTLIIFFALMFILSRYAFKPMLAAVEAREKALEEAIEGAKRDREEAARLLDEQKKHLADARTQAQTFIAEGRATAEKMRTDLLEQTRTQQMEVVERAKRDIETEKVRAIDEMRRQSVELALAGAGRVLERNLDDASNRAIVEKFLSGLSTKN